MNDCPNCEYHRQRAARWRAEAYKLSGYDGIELPWKGLTGEEIQQVFIANSVMVDNGNTYMVAGLRAVNIGTAIEAKLKEKNT